MSDTVPDHTLTPHSDTADTKAPPITKASLQEMLDGIVRDNLRPVTAGLSAFYSVLGLCYLLFLPAPLHVPLVATAFGTAALLIGIYDRLRRSSLSTRWAHPLGAGVVFLALINTLLYLRLTADLAQTTVLILLVVGAALFLLSWRWLALLLAVILVGWVLTVRSVAPSQSSMEWVHFGFSLGVAMLMAVLTQRAQIRTYRRFANLCLQDAHRRHKLEDALAIARESAEKYRDLFENANDLIQSVGPDGSFHYVNRAWRETLGYSEEEIPHLTLRDILHPDSIEHCTKILQRVLAGEVVEGVEAKLVAKDGRIIIVEGNVNCLFKDGQPVTTRGIFRNITERKLAEEALEKERDFITKILDTVGALIVVLDREGRIVRFNRTCERVTGYSFAEVKGKRVWEILLIPEEVEPVKAVFEDLRAGRFPNEYENYWVTRTGDRRLIAWSNTAILDAEGQVEYIIGTGIDVTERRKIERALEKERKLLHTLINHLPDFIYVKDSEGRFILVNEAVAHRMGASTPDELIGKTDFDFYPQELATQYYEDEQAIMRSGKPLLNKEEPGRDEAGAPRWQLTTKIPLRDSDGQVIGLVGITRDITERKRAEEKLRLQATALEAAANGIVITDQDGTIQWVNPAFTRLTGYTATEAIGQNPRILKSGKQDRAFYQDMWDTILSGKIWRGELINRRKDGNLYVEEMSITPVYGDEGEITHFVAIKQDITERKRAEEELRQAKEAAEAATCAKSAFVANMSHEIRTPLNAIIGMTSLLLDTNLDPEQREFAEIIRSSSDALLVLINDILDFSKIEAGKMDLEYQPFDLRTCIEEALDLVATKAAEKGLDLAYLIDNDVPTTPISDATRVRQILVNLLSNAVKFTHEGEVVVSVTGRPLDDRYYEFHFAVRDTGIGIPKDRQHRLFQPFTQIDASTTRQYGGTGLGLAICKRLTEMLGGSIWVESEEGKGSTFHFTIRARVSQTPVVSQLTEPPPQLAGKRILIVDDNATNRLILTRQAQSWEMVPRATASGSEALEWLRQGEPFDLAILDMHMPEMDGITLAKEIRKLRDSDSLPLVMLTSIGRMDGSDQEVDFAAFLSKPIKPSQLYNVLVSIVAHQPISVSRPSKPQRIDSSLAERYPLRILLAEDNIVNQKVALRLLERMGYRADVAANGLEVLQSLRRQPYDVILMDVQMPEMDGLEATRRIRQLWDADCQPYIIAMTAHALREDRDRCLAAGMDDYISKPVRVEELSAALQRGAQRRKEEPPAEPPKEEEEQGPALDRNTLQQFRETMGEETLQELIASYLEEAPQLLAQIREALAQGDAPTVQRAAHTFKSTSALFGATRLANLCKEVEFMGREGRLENVEEKVNQIEAEYEKVKAILVQEQEATLEAQPA
ncbi:MAG: PAS domain S-box protein [Chloroflexi bacterium]|nr:PAS domain S-box protein [Chloroflexota bacterium]